MNRNGITPMHMACRGGHLLVCKWLFEAGAAEDIFQVLNLGSPMKMAFHYDQRAVCHWLVLKGALCGASGHVDRSLATARLARRLKCEPVVAARTKI